MIVILSPAKSLDFDSEVKKENFSLPAFQQKANQLAEELQKLSPKQLTDMMNISTRLANLNYERFQDWKQDPTEAESRQAIFAFKGDVYQGLQIKTYNNLDLEYAQEHLRILSGMYGILKPLDLIQPYRLEMGTGIKINGNKNLYEFWGESITKKLKEDMPASANKLINLASMEYFKSIEKDQLKAEVITPVFKENKSGTYKIISFHAKKARGRMATFILRNRIEDVEEIKTFEEDGYVFNPKMSSGTELVFTRG